MRRRAESEESRGERRDASERPGGAPREMPAPLEVGITQAGREDRDEHHAQAAGEGSQSEADGSDLGVDGQCG
jgi:hypothetical protein